MLTLGGDHSITYPVLKAYARTDLVVVHVDAHPDLYDAYDGNPLSHGSPFARICRRRALRAPESRLGIRTLTPHQREQADRFGVEVHEMRDWLGTPVLSFDAPVYVSFDLDGIDPAFCPGVAHWEPGGLSTRQALDVVHAIDAPLVGADVVELNPGRDPCGVDGPSSMVAARVARELLAKMLESAP